MGIGKSRPSPTESDTEGAELQSINSDSSQMKILLDPRTPLTSEELDHIKDILSKDDKVAHEELRQLILEREDALVEARFDDEENNLLHLVSTYTEISKATAQIVANLFKQRNMLHGINATKMEPLHVAATWANLTVMEVLLPLIDEGNRNRCCAEAKTPYIVMIKDPIYERYFGSNRDDLSTPEHQRRVDCLNVMLEYGLDINKVDFADKSPIFWAASYGYKHIVEAILNQTYQKVDLDTVMSGKSPRKIIQGRKLYPDPLPEPFEYKMSPVDQLFKHLRHRNIEPFMKTLNQVAQSQVTNELEATVNGDNQSYTVLQFACIKNIHQIVDILLERGADPNKTIPQNRKPPLEIALSWSNSDIIQRLLEQEDLEIPELLLHNVLEYAHQFDAEMVQDKIRCVGMILKSPKYRGLHAFDEDGFIPLNYTALVPDLAVLLLANGASLACRNAHNVLSVKYMELDTLTMHFNACVKEEVGYDKEELYIKNYVAKFDFRSLLQPGNKELQQIPALAQESQDPQEQKEQSNDQEDYITSKASETSLNETESIMARETDVILYMSRNPKLRPLLKHPTVKAFLYMKWHLLRWFFYLNMLLYGAYCVFQLFYVFHTCLGGSSETTIWKPLLTIAVILLTVRELVEMALLRKYYLFPREAIEQITIADLNFENLCEVALYSMTYFILFSDGTPEIRKQFSIVVVLSTAAVLVLNLERMPLLNTKMAMLKRVTENIFKTFITFSIIIIPFALSFSILYKEHQSNSSPSNATNFSTIEGHSNSTSWPEIQMEVAPDEDDTQFFDNFYLSVFKTVIMMTGEYEMKDSIDFEKYPVASSVLFVLFVFFVAIIVFNLLTGLAVSDTQAIVNEAELFGLISRTQHICYIESLLHRFNIRKKFSISHRYPEIKVFPNKYAEVIFPPKENPPGENDAVGNGQQEFGYFANLCMFMGVNVWVLRLGDKIARDTLTIIEERNAKQRKKFKKKVVDLENENMGLKKRIKELKTEMRLLKESNKR